MVIDGAPLYGIVSPETVWLWTVVVVELEDMMQPQGHHVVHAVLAASLHQLGEGGNEMLLAAEGLHEPFLRDGG